MVKKRREKNWWMFPGDLKKELKNYKDLIRRSSLV